MKENRRNEIIMATLKLASQKGLKAVSMNMIAEEVGIKKPSLYNHFKSKEELVEQMYLFLRDSAKKQANIPADFVDFDGKSACEILSGLVKNYVSISTEENMQMFYKVIYCERAISSEASKIMVAETEKMINATKYALALLSDRKLLHFNDIEVSALSFALTIHSLMDYCLDLSLSRSESPTINMDLIDNFIILSRAGAVKPSAKKAVFPLDSAYRL